MNYLQVLLKSGIVALLVAFIAMATSCKVVAQEIDNCITLVKGSDSRYVVYSGNTEIFSNRDKHKALQNFANALFAGMPDVHYTYSEIITGSILGRCLEGTPVDPPIDPPIDPPVEPDTDGDGIPDATDDCPNDATNTCNDPVPPTNEVAEYSVDGVTWQPLEGAVLVDPGIVSVRLAPSEADRFDMHCCTSDTPFVGHSPSVDQSSNVFTVDFTSRAANEWVMYFNYWLDGQFNGENYINFTIQRDPGTDSITTTWDHPTGWVPNSFENMAAFITNNPIPSGTVLPGGTELIQSLPDGTAEARLVPEGETFLVDYSLEASDIRETCINYSCASGPISVCVPRENLIHSMSDITLPCDVTAVTVTADGIEGDPATTRKE